MAVTRKRRVILYLCVMMRVCVVQVDQLIMKDTVEETIFRCVALPAITAASAAAVTSGIFILYVSVLFFLSHKKLGRVSPTAALR